ncbi:MAG: hypothetical protein Q9202_001048 [Teloschistes flavicans]
MAGTDFNHLPLELRNRIYDHCKPAIAVLTLIGDQVTIRERQGVNVWKYATRSLPILQLDRRNRHDATALLYEKCTFALSLRQHQDLDSTLLGSPISNSWPDRFLQLSKVREIRNWDIQLKWDLYAFRDTQPKALTSLMKGVVDILSRSDRIDSLTVRFGCLCSMSEGGYYKVVIDEMGRPTKLRPFRGEAFYIIKDMLKLLECLPTVKEAVFIPTLSISREHRRWGRCEVPCIDRYCSFFLRRLVLDGLREFLEGEWRPEDILYDVRNLFLEARDNE